MEFSLRLLQFRRPTAWTTALTTAVLLAFALKLSIAYTTYGTNDMTSWQRFAAVAHHVGGAALYRSEALFNHPPFMVHVLQVLVQLTYRTGIPFPFWLRLPAILADLVTVILVGKLLTPQHQDWGRRGALVLLAVAPALIMISGFHGNTDPAMMCFVVLTVYLIERRTAIILAGAAFGMALSIKVVPLIFIPVMVCYLATWRARLTFGVVAATIWVGGALPYVIQVPEVILDQVFGYAGNYGQWGISRIFMLAAAYQQPGAPWSDLNHGAYGDVGRVVSLGSSVVVAVWMNRATVTKPPLFLQCGLVVFLFLALSPAFGVQYLAWLMPWVVALGVRATLVLYTASGLLLFRVYTFWAGAFPWHSANSPEYGWQGTTIVLDLLCWGCVVAILMCYGTTIWHTQHRLVDAPDVEARRRDQATP